MRRLCSSALIIKPGAEGTAANIKDLFYYSDATLSGYGAKAATTANGLPAYLTDGSMQVYGGSALTQDYSYMNQGAYIKVNKKQDANPNSTIVTKNFNIADNTADQLLLKFNSCAGGKRLRRATSRV